MLAEVLMHVWGEMQGGIDVEELKKLRAQVRR
jgi:hypothetical protein